MATTVRDFLHSTTEQDFTASGEVDIRKLVEAAPGSNATTICTHANATGTTQITLDPYTNRSTTGDIRTNAGWAINRLGADGMESTATSKRVIPAGAWQFTLNLSLPVAGLTTGSLTGSFIAQVFRVSSTGTRTALFTATSNTGQSTGLAALASTTLTATSASQPAYTLEADETIHVGYISNLVQVSGVAGATVSGVATWTVGTASQFVRVPSPGIRSNHLLNQSVVASTISQAIKSVSKTLSNVAVVFPNFTRQITAFKVFFVVATGTPAFSRILSSFRTFNAVASGSPSIIRRVGKPFSALATGTATNIRRMLKTLTVTATATPSLVKRLTKNAFLAVSTVVPNFARAVTAARTFFVNATATPTFIRRFQAARTLSVVGTGTPLMVRRVGKLFTILVTVTPSAIRRITRSLSVVATGTPTFIRAVTAARTFTRTVTVSAKMLVQIADTVLNRMTGGGGATIIKKVFNIFDD